MLRKFALALVAGTFFAVPVLAQGTAVAPRAPISHPVKHTAHRTVAAKPIFAKAHKHVKVSKVKKHKVVAKHAKRGFSHHRIHVSGKPATPFVY